MELTKRELEFIKQALGYGLVFSKDEAETAEFGMLLVKFEGEIVRKSQEKK